MARRRFARSKTTPDMGWIVGAYNTGVTWNGGQYTTGSDNLFDFADVDAEALTGRIEADKSDWFVKRVILDWCSAYATTETGPTDVARRWQFGIGIAFNNNIDDITANDYGIMSPEFYNLHSRLFRTFETSVYAGGLLPYAQEDATSNIGLATVNLADAANLPAGYSTTAPFWGPSGGHADFEVSNAGLRNNQSCHIAIALCDGPSAGFDWKEQETLYVRFTYRVLMQKRRV